MKPLLPPIGGPLGCFGRGEPRYSKTEDEMDEIARERSATRIQVLIDVIRRAGTTASGILERPDGAGHLLLLTSQIYEGELGRVHLECAILDENSVGGPLRSID